ncbi:hypothetical protein D3C73_1366200 [compost metagenome]
MFGCGAVFDLDALEVVADLDGVGLEGHRQLDERRQGQMWGDHTVQGETQGFAHYFCSPHK